MIKENRTTRRKQQQFVENTVYILFESLQAVLATKRTLLSILRISTPLKVFDYWAEDQDSEK
jgi:hypothetical protein